MLAMAGPSTSDINRMLSETVVQRGTIVPLSEYADGSVRFDWDAGIAAPFGAINRMLTPGYDYSNTRQAAGDALNASSLAFTGGLAANAAGLVPRGAVGSAGGKAPVGNVIRAYHGSPRRFDVFDDGDATWFTTSERTAERFGADRASDNYHQNANSIRRLRNEGRLHLYEVDIDDGRILTVDPLEEAKQAAKSSGIPDPQTWEEAAELLPWGDFQNQIIRDARNQGFDGVRFLNVGDDPVGAVSDHIAVLNNKIIKMLTRNGEQF